jgi:hypothetical protein
VDKINKSGQFKFMRFFFCVLSFSILCYASDLKAQHTYVVDELIKLNQSHWDSIESIELEYRAESIVNGSVELPEYPVLWIRSDGRERLSWQALMQEESDSKKPTKSKSDLLTRADIYCTNEQVICVYDLRDSEYSAPKTVDEAFLMAKVAVDRGPTHPKNRSLLGRLIGRYPMVNWFFQDQFGMSFSGFTDRYRNLSEFVLAHPTTSPIRTVVNGDVLWTFRIDTNDSEKKRKMPNNHIEVSLNENKSFFIHRLKYYNNEIPTEKIIVETEVLDYIKLNNGGYFPKRMVKRRYQEGKTALRENTLFFDVLKVSINETIPDSVFEYEIPPYSKVYDMPVNDEKYAVFHIWGPDNKPLLTLDTPEKFNKFVEELSERVKGKRSVSSISVSAIPLWRIILCLMGVGFIMLSLFLTIRKNKYRK